jgi:hypothetical protein
MTCSAIPEKLTQYHDAAALIALSPLVSHAILPFRRRRRNSRNIAVPVSLHSYDFFTSIGGLISGEKFRGEPHGDRLPD